MSLLVTNRLTVDSRQNRNFTFFLKFCHQIVQFQLSNRQIPSRRREIGQYLISNITFSFADVKSVFSTLSSFLFRGSPRSLGCPEIFISTVLKLLPGR